MADMSIATELTPHAPVLPVSELVRQARQILEKSFPLLWVGGEISNLTRASSGHWYFSLKDASAQVRCVMFRNKNQYLDWIPDNGMQVELRALPSLYEARGEFQLNVETMRRSGLGALYEAFEKLKARLEREGLFDTARKRPLPAFPRQVGIITSPAAAALRDVLSTLRRRMPSIPLVLYPVPVQGEGAAEKIAHAIQQAGNRAECEVLILCRGGGSIEDLWAFNEEMVARAIHACPIPILCGVGHETDFTIADFVADRRAPTPTGAAEMAVPDREDLLHRLSALGNRVDYLVRRSLEQRMQHIDYLARRMIHPAERLNNQLRHLGHLHRRLQQTGARALDAKAWALQLLSRRIGSAKPDMRQLSGKLPPLAHRMRLAAERLVAVRSAKLTSLSSQLEQLNPLTVLARGFSMVETADGELVRDSSQVQPGTDIKVTLAHGWLKADVKESGRDDRSPEKKTN